MIERLQCSCTDDAMMAVQAMITALIVRSPSGKECSRGHDVMQLLDDPLPCGMLRSDFCPCRW